MQGDFLAVNVALCDRGGVCIDVCIETDPEDRADLLHTYPLLEHITLVLCAVRLSYPSLIFRAHDRDHIVVFPLRDSCMTVCWFSCAQAVTLSILLCTTYAYTAL